jgi:AcrR family transcriptional regulator
MSPGSGALYRHFRSKSDVLRAALRRGLDRMRTSPAWRHATTPAERLDALASVAEAAQQTIADNADLMRLLLHEPDAAPDMVEELWVHNLAIAHQIMGQALQASAHEAGSEIDDPEAISAVLLAALSYICPSCKFCSVARPVTWTPTVSGTPGFGSADPCSPTAFPTSSASPIASVDRGRAA